MRKLAILLLCCLATPASAQLLLYDGFDYPAAMPPDPPVLLAPLNDTSADPHPGQHNVDFNVDWRYAGAGGATNQAPGTTSGTLTQTGLPPSEGNSVLFDHSQLGFTRIEIPNAPASGPRYYWSGLFRVNTLGNLRSTVMLPGATNGVFLGGFNNVVGPGTTINAGGALLLVRPDFETTPLEPKPDSYQIGTGSTTNNNDKVFADMAPQAVGSTVFIVASYEVVEGTLNDIAKMWINPVPSSYGAAENMLPTETLLTSGSNVGNDLPQIASFQLRNNNAIYENTNWQFDELRIGTTWASVTLDVTPPPPLAGDYDNNGKVEGADLVVWQGSFGMTGASLPADGDDDGDVDGADFLTWQANLGAMTNPPGAAVPEPASSWLAALVVSALLVRSNWRTAAQSS
jgi:hypothetical protein